LGRTSGSRRTAHRRQPRRDTPGGTRPARWAHSREAGLGYAVASSLGRVTR
jgi:hypothetical protein